MGCNRDFDQVDRLLDVTYYYYTNKDSYSPLLITTLTPYCMWLLPLLLIILTLSLPSSLELKATQSSNHLHIPLTFDSKIVNKMCFAHTKTLKFLREKNQNSDTVTDLGFNWEDNCDYLPFDSIETLPTSNNDLRIIQLNIRGLKGKLDELGNLLGKLKYPDVVILNETWLKDCDKNRIRINNYVYKGRPRVNKKGGGVGFLIRNDVIHRYRNDLELSEYTPSCEHSCIEIKGKTKNIIISSMYRPPNTDVNEFLNKFKSILNNIKKSGSECIIGLNHNLDLLK